MTTLEEFESQYFVFTYTLTGRQWVLVKSDTALGRELAVGWRIDTEFFFVEYAEVRDFLDAWRKNIGGS